MPVIVPYQESFEKKSSDFLAVDIGEGIEEHTLNITFY
jgi:hypothetical protein